MFVNAGFITYGSVPQADANAAIECHPDGMGGQIFIGFRKLKCNEASTRSS